MAGILCLNGFLGMGITMTNESLEQRIAKQEERLKQQEERLKQLKAQKQAKDAREKAKQKEQDRKDDTRRKILAGSFLLKQMEDEAKKTKILADLNEYLTEDRDRKLFDLPNIEEN
jgi:membrane protein involved in colicin uptake